MAILGDSDNHAYQDRISFPPGSAKRGGALRHQTLQWTEVLDRLRGNAVDLGAWGEWGHARPVELARRVVGLPVRVPRKEDHEHNFAISGSECDALLEGRRAQVHQLLRQMANRPERWVQGVVVIRIGINSLGKKEDLDLFAKEGVSATTTAMVDRCVQPIAEATRMIRREHPRTRVVVMGIADNVDWPPFLQFWQNPVELARIAAVNDLYDNGLRRLAASDPGVFFFDDRAWFRGLWGQRGPDGRADYRVVRLPSGLEVRNTAGDTLDNAIIGDGHGGTVLNALFARDVVAFLNASLGTSITPIRDAEIDSLIAGLQRTGR